MKSLREYFRNKHIDRKLKKLSKVRFVLTNNYLRTWTEEGPRTYGRIEMWKTLMYALEKVYGEGFEGILHITSIEFDEEPKSIGVTIGTSRPGYVIGLRGSKIDELTKILGEVYGKQTVVWLNETKNLYGMEFKEDY